MKWKTKEEILNKEKEYKDRESSEVKKESE